MFASKSKFFLFVFGGVLMFCLLPVVSARAGEVEKTINFGASGDTIYIPGKMGIKNSAPNANLQINASSGTEGLRITSASDWSPLNIQNSSNVDIFRVDQTGSLAVGIIPWGRLTSFPTACTGGQYVTGIGSTLTCATPAGGVSGSGTANYITKWSGTSAIGNSAIYENGGNVGVGTTAVSTYKLNVAGTSYFSGAMIASGTINARGNISNDGANYLNITGGAGGITYFSGSPKVGIATATPVANLQINASASTEGLRIVSASNYSPLNIQNSSNVDMFRVDQTGSLAIGSIPWERLTSFPTACTAGQYVTGIGDTLTCATPAGGVSGSGTANYVARWIGASTLSSGALYDNGTNVGIGTTSPEAKLEVNGSILLPNNVAIQWRANTGAVRDVLKLSSSNVLDLSSVGRITFGNGNYFAQNSPVNYSETLFTGTSSNIAAMTWRETGNVGIGTTNPSFKLTTSYVPNATFTNTISDFVQMWQNGATNILGVAAATTGSHVYFGTNNSYDFNITYGSSVLATFLNNGNVGIGTTTPNTALHIYKTDSANPDLKLQTSVTGAAARLYMSGVDSAGNNMWRLGDVNTGSDLALVNDQTGKIILSTAAAGGDISLAPRGVERLAILAAGGVSFNSAAASIDTSGNLTAESFIDKSGASYKIDPSNTGTSINVAGGISGTVLSASSQVCINSDCKSAWPGGSITGSGTSGTITKWSGSSAIGNSIITDNGTAVSISTSSTTYKLNVGGDVGATSFVYTSDRNLKKNIKTLDNALDKILKLRGVSFNWKDNNRPSVGLIAQEVEQVFPELVTGNEIKGVQYGNLVAPIIEAVKAQQQEIKNQSLIIQTQQEQIENLSARLRALELNK